MEIYSAANLGPRVQVHFKGRGRTKQADADSVDINLIMKRYIKTGMIDHLSRYGAEYGFASSITFHEAMNVVTKADQMFADLPAQARRRFGGDPAEFLEFVQNPENQAEMVKLGLAKAESETSPEPVPELPDAPITPEVVPDAGGGDTAVEAV